MNKNGFAYHRQIPIDPAYDVVVAGAGPAGSAARLGAKVLLIEGTGCAGGMGTVVAELRVSSA